MSDIFREIEEEVRRDQAKQLWDRYGAYVIVVAILIVAVTAGWRGWQWYSARLAAEAGAEYYAAMQLARDGKNEEAELAFNEIAAKGGGIAALARLRAASALSAAGDSHGAVAEYDAVASGSREADVRNVARVRAALILLDQDDRAGVEARVGDMAAEGDLWRSIAREILGLAAYQAGDYEVATERFEEIIADGEAPADLRSRAQLMMTLLASERAPDSSGTADSQ